MMIRKKCSLDNVYPHYLCRHFIIAGAVWRNAADR